MDGRRFYLLLVFVCWFETSLTLECYSCGHQLGMPDSSNDCETFHYADWEHHKIAQCPYPDSVCAKYVVDYGGMTWVHRSCKHHDICTFLSTTYNNDRNLLLECETCSDQNLCNSAVVHTSGFAVILLLLIYIFFTKS